VSTPPYGQDPYSQPPTYGAPYGTPYGGYSQPPVSGVPASGAPASGAPYPYQHPYQEGYAVPVAYSDKSKLAAGLLQLLPAFFLGLGGIGRLYAGNVGLGVAQIVLSVVGWISFWCGFFLFLPFVIFFGLWLWFVIDGILVLAGRPVDGQGRPLRP
jgi:TM2 domain-containing membrane protein YozV